MIFERGEFALQQHNELRDLEVELLSTVKRTVGHLSTWLLRLKATLEPQNA